MPDKPTYQDLENRVNELELAEKELMKNEQRYRFLINATTAIYWTTDASGGFIVPQPSWEKFTGQPWSEHQGFGWTKKIHPDDVERIQKVWADACETLSLYKTRGQVWNAALEQYRDFEVRAVPIMGPDNRLFEWAGFMIDITEQKNHKKALEKSEQNYRLLYENATDAIFISQDGFIKMANPASEKMIGYSKEELAKMPISKLIHPDDWELALANNRRRMDNNEPTVYSHRAVTKSGKIIWVEDHGIRINWEGGPASLTFKRDITEQKELSIEREKNLKQLRKALDEIKTLKGILPICSHCKKIRNDKGIWDRLEEYILEHSDAELSHSICPDCAKIHYPDYDLYD